MGAFEEVPERRVKPRLNDAICAMKDATRLAQSNANQAVE